MNPILIHKSDSTVFANVNKFLTFFIDSHLDLTGWTAKFILGWVEKTIDDISTKSFEIILGAEDTKQLRLGKQYGTIIITDSNGNIKTVTNTIPFEVTTAVVENEYQEIDLTIPESSGVDIRLRVGLQGGGGAVNSVNGMTGDVVLEIPTLVSQLQNDEGFATSLEVMQAIASIPQFKLLIVNELPLGGEKMTLYLVPKAGSNNDVYNEYIWIEQTASFEFLGTTAVDLSQYYTKTEIDSKIGNINQMLDVINGEVI